MRSMPLPDVAAGSIASPWTVNPPTLIVSFGDGLATSNLIVEENSLPAIAARCGVIKPACQFGAKWSCHVGLCRTRVLDYKT